MIRPGFWDSPLSAAEVVAAATTVDLLSAVRAGSGRVVWAESRPQEEGRITLIEATADGGEREILPQGYSARSAVHEYGGAAFSIIDGSIYFVNWDDQRIYRLDESATPVTEEPPSPRAWRYSVISGSERRLFAIRERHEADTVINEVVAILDGEIRVVASGSDFYDGITLSPSQERLAWIEWDHPNMPWDDTRLVVADKDGADPRVVASGTAVQQPSWSDDETIIYVDDRTGYWNLFRHELSSGTDTPLFETDHDMGDAPFLLGTSTCSVIDKDRTAAVLIRGGMDELGVIENGEFQACAPGLSFVRGLVQDDGIVYFVGGSFTQGMAIYRLEKSNEVHLVSTPKPVPLDDEYIAVGEHHSFDSGDRTTHAIIYRPRNPAEDGTIAEGSLPPLVVMIHGGPTSHARAQFRTEVQYWTTRGFAVADVNYGGSTGYGKAYRNLLRDSWGIVDVEDCVAVAQGLVERGMVDGSGLFVRGGSAGGFTTLAILAASDIFAAGGNLFGVSDLAALARDTHKFESRYLDGLVGPYPEAESIYEDRSPLSHLDEFSTPLIVFQGDEDKVVPPQQSRSIVEALENKGIPVEYHEFPGEGHGFRHAENMQTVLERELVFYQDQLRHPFTAT